MRTLPQVHQTASDPSAGANPSMLLSTLCIAIPGSTGVAL